MAVQRQRGYAVGTEQWHQRFRYCVVATSKPAWRYGPERFRNRGLHQGPRIHRPRSDIQKQLVAPSRHVRIRCKSRPRTKYGRELCCVRQQCARIRKNGSPLLLGHRPRLRGLRRDPASASVYARFQHPNRGRGLLLGECGFIRHSELHSMGPGLVSTGTGSGTERH